MYKPYGRKNINCPNRPLHKLNDVIFDIDFYWKLEYLNGKFGFLVKK